MPTTTATSALCMSVSTDGGTLTTIDRSTLTLLEHVNLNVPNHDYILPFYFDLLRCGLDPRRAPNVAAGSSTVWANCGASQFHLPYGEEAQVVPGSIGLRYSTLDGLKERLAKADEQKEDVSEKCFKSYEISKEGDRESIEIQDRYGNVFYCRQGPEKFTDLRQPIVSATETDDFGDVATQYGSAGGESECRGIDYVEFRCPVGAAEKIAVFYDSILDATTSVVQDAKGETLALVAFGDIEETGRAQQYLLFRESTEPTPPYDGHHVALYVGQNAADFDQAYRNCETAGVVWVNPRFSDKATTLAGARQWQQFRFQDILDIETGEKILTLEHEVRSVDHSAWPGKVACDE
jgi:hypothetical protein